MTGTVTGDQELRAHGAVPVSAGVERNGDSVDAIR